MTGSAESGNRAVEAAASGAAGLMAERLATFRDAQRPETSRTAKSVLLHNLIVALAAQRMPLPGIQDGAPLPWASEPASLPDRAFAAALRMGARAQHDEHPRSVTHLGSAVTPAVLAVARPDAEGAQVLAAIATGYQAGGSLGTLVLPFVRARGLRATGVVGPIAAAAGAASMLGLDEARTAHAIALAANRAAGFTEVWLAGSDEWRLQTAAAARDGLESALWAAGGAEGAPGAIDGRSGLLRALGVTEADIAAIVGELGARLDGPAVIEQMLLKAHPVCAINQAAVEVTIRLRRGLSAGDIERIASVQVQLTDADAAYPGIDADHPPRSWAQAMMDMRRGVAVALANGGVDVEQLHPATAHVQRLHERIDVVGGGADTGRHGAAVTVTLRDGRQLADAADGVVVDASRSAEMARVLLPAAGVSEGLATTLPFLVEGIDDRDGFARLCDALQEVEPWGSLCR